MTPRPCHRCGQPIPRGQKCRSCTRPAYGNAERTRRRRAVEAHRVVYGDVCPGFGVDPHPSSDLTADHVTAVAAGGAEGGTLRVLCRSCNSRRGAR